MVRKKKYATPVGAVTPGKAFQIIEETLLALKDASKLDRETLTAVLEPYRGVELDFGKGWSGQLSKEEGHGILRVTIEAFGDTYTEPPYHDHQRKTDPDYDPETEHEIWIDQEADHYHRIMEDHFGIVFLD